MGTEQRHLEIVYNVFVSQIQRLLLDHNTSDNGYVCSTTGEAETGEFLGLTFQPS